MLSRKIATNSAISAGARIIGNVTSLIIIGMIARTLPQEEVGQYFTIIAFVFTFSFLADLGLYSLLVRDISRPKANEKKIVSTVFSLRIAALVIAMILASVSALFFPYSELVKLGIALASVHVFFLSASQVLMGVFQKYLKLGRTAIAEVAGRIVQLGIVWYVVQEGGGLIGVIWALVAAGLISFIIIAIGAHKLVPFTLSIDTKAWLETAKRALPMGLSVIITALYFRLDTVMISVFVGDADVGIFNIGYRVLEALIFFPAMFVGLVMPQLSRYAVSNMERFQHFFQKAFNIILIVGIPAVVGLMLKSEGIVTLLGGENYLVSAPVLTILAPAIGMIFFGALFANSLIALNKQKLLAWIYFGGLIFDAVSNIIFIPKYSYIAASWTTLGTETIVTIGMAIAVFALLKRAPSFAKILPVFVAAGAMALFLFKYDTLPLLPAIAIAAVIYIAVLVLLKGVRKATWHFSESPELAVPTRGNRSAAEKWT